MKAVRRLVTIDLRGADIALFEAYEARVIPLMARHGGRLEMRLRAAKDLSEVHLVYFPNDTALSAYQSDPEREAAQDLWRRSGASAHVVAVEHFTG